MSTNVKNKRYWRDKFEKKKTIIKLVRQLSLQLRQIDSNVWVQIEIQK